jgi:N-acetylneuraminic acid mutarotase
MNFGCIEKKSEFLPGYNNSTLVYHPKTNLIYLLGGIDPKFQVHSTLEVYDPVANEWTRGKSKSNICERYNHTCVAYSDFLVVFGGNVTIDRLCQASVHLYNVMKKEWISIHRDFQPTSRQNHSATLYHDGMYLFGGRDQKEWKPDLYKFDLETHFWSLVKIKSILEPKPRFGHSAVSVDHHFYVFGGVTGISTYTSDLWRFDCQMRTWKEMIPSSCQVPSPRADATMIFHQNKMILYGGQDALEIHDSVFVYKPLFETWSRVKSTWNAKRNHAMTNKGIEIWCFGGNARGRNNTSLEHTITQQNDLLPFYDVFIKF